MYRGKINIHEKSITELTTLTYLQYISKVRDITENTFKYTNYIQEDTCVIRPPTQSRKYYFQDINIRQRKHGYYNAVDSNTNTSAFTHQPINQLKNVRYDI